jgi:HlyD family secretion protein
MKVSRALPLAIAVAALTAAGGCQQKKDPNAELKAALEQSSQRAQLVTAATASTRMFSRTLLVSGAVRPVDDIRVFSPIGNVRINKVLADVGETVREGQALATIDAPLADAQAQSSKAQVARAKAAVVDARVTYKNAQADLDRALTIADTGALSAEQLDARRARAEGAAAKLALAEADLQFAEAQNRESAARLQGGAIRAPRAGVVIERQANPGQMAESGVLFRIVGGGSLELSADVAEDDLNLMIRGQRATFALPTGGAVEARLRRAPVSVADQTRAGQAIFDLTDSRSVKVGMFLRGEAKLPPKSYLAVPAASIVYDDGRPSLFVIDDESRVRKRNVVLGPRDGEMIAVIDGLTEGQRVASGGVAFLMDGDIVRTQQS